SVARAPPAVRREGLHPAAEVLSYRRSAPSAERRARTASGAQATQREQRDQGGEDQRADVRERRDRGRPLQADLSSVGDGADERDDRRGGGTRGQVPGQGRGD